MRHLAGAAVTVAVGVTALAAPTAGFVAPLRLQSAGCSWGSATRVAGRRLTRVASVRLPTRPEGPAMEPSVLSEAAMPSESPVLGDAGGVVERKSKSGPAPKIVIEGDMLEGTWQQRAIVMTGFAISAVALIQAAAGLSLAGPLAVAQLVGTLAFSVLFSDFFSGVFHWTVDNYGDGNTPVMGSVIAAFQGHHEAPWTITYRPFENNVHKISAVTIPALLAILVAHPAPLAAIFGVLFFNLQVLSQEFHKLSHLTKPPQWAQTLQDAGLILSRRAHGAHHSSPFEGNYCILTGTCNDALDSSGFFRRLEVLVYRATGAEPNCWKLDPEVKREALATMSK